MTAQACENYDEVAEAEKLAKDIPEHVSSVLTSVQAFHKRIAKEELQTTKGMSFLNVKNQTLLSYIINLSYIIMRKMSGKKIENDKAVERLVELRTVLEKMKPINERLKYQINKLLSSVTSGNIDSKDPLRYKANPDNLASKDDMEAESTQEEKKSSNIYVPPKISAAYFDGEDTIETRKQKILERAQKRALNSSMMYDLRKEYDTGPEEIKETVDPHKIKLIEEINERARYEEEYMLRLPRTKKHRHDARQVTTVTNFSTKFESISALDLQASDMPLKKKTSSKKFKPWKGKGKKKGFKRRGH